MENLTECNKGILFSTYEIIAPKVLTFEKLNYKYFKNKLTNEDMFKIIKYYMKLKACQDSIHI